MKSHPRLLASDFALLATAPAWAQTAEAGKAFDGPWQAHLSCDDAREQPDYTFGKMQPASPYHYTMRGQFDAQRGLQPAA